jgi:uncharacterized protein
MFERLRRLMPTPQSVAGNRWLRWMGPSLLHPRLWHLSRRGVALGAAIGVFFAFITPVAQIPMSAGVCMLLRANVPVSVLSTLVNSPPTFAPVYYGAWKVGSWVLGERSDDGDTPALLAKADRSTLPMASAHAAEAAAEPALPWWRRWGQALSEVGKPLLLGTMIFAVVSSLTAYGLVSGVWHWRVRAKRRRRLQARG